MSTQQPPSPTTPTSPTTTSPSDNNTTTNTTTNPSSPSPSQTQRTTEARAAFTASLQSVGANYDAELRDRARNLHDNTAALDKQQADLQRATTELGRQNEQWGKVTDTAREGLKEIGDVQNWAELIERDLLVVEETLRMVEEEDEAVGRVEGGNGNGNDDKKGRKAGGWMKWW
ncbi:hypothetical protein ASPWEDRAFT_666894 [Aspergillus wentii DTO 134E9]|uniref:Biogenesis of lysosome-related organelles complex 1 subunit 1 n=1 Tax=Aspergillus wentii DTO 134E9 TaxID=1073089 RepID=A0A1L9RC24_ASPWE|nr:uncharacterized protein ASPWEDRAFT_666894 [Aspergillus wentii DTO 134E9]KAI9935020.1 hypothetical protein MW887_000641 [Aspergillus wentii]OJJ32462.1 hypothetical protein ASPWEDRAFT_666894 [Aspergillus wentii DTO 134E9]